MEDMDMVDMDIVAMDMVAMDMVAMDMVVMVDMDMDMVGLSEKVRRVKKWAE